MMIPCVSRIAGVYTAYIQPSSLCLVFSAQLWK